MNGYAKKVGHTLLFGLVIFAVAIVVWLVYTSYNLITIGAIITLIIWGVYIMTLIYLK